MNTRGPFSDGESSKRNVRGRARGEGYKRGNKKISIEKKRERERERERESSTVRDRREERVGEEEGRG